MKSLLIANLLLTSVLIVALLYFGHRLFEIIARYYEQLEKLITETSRGLMSDMEQSKTLTAKLSSFLNDRLTLLGDEQIVQHQKMASMSEQMHEDVMDRVSRVDSTVEYHVEALTKQAQEIKDYAKQIIDAKTQYEGNLHIPRAKCDFCQRVVWQFGMVDDKVACGDCVSAGRHLPPPPVRPIAKVSGGKR
jgi:hypothetical protein